MVRYPVEKSGRAASIIGVLGYIWPSTPTSSELIYPPQPSNNILSSSRQHSYASENNKLIHYRNSNAVLGLGLRACPSMAKTCSVNTPCPHFISSHYSFVFNPQYRTPNYSRANLIFLSIPSAWSYNISVGLMRLRKSSLTRKNSQYPMQNPKPPCKATECQKTFIA